MPAVLTLPALAVCKLACVEPALPSPLETVAVTQAVLDGAEAEGVRYRAGGHFSGWFLAAPTDPQELSEEALLSIHAVHLFEERPDVARFLALPAGWRFESRGEGLAWFDPGIDLDE